MDLMSKRCGCGTIYRPAVRTQATCDACGERKRAVARAAVESERVCEQLPATVVYGGDPVARGPLGPPTAMDGPIRE